MIDISKLSKSYSVRILEESPEAVARTYLKMLDGRMDQIISLIMNARNNVMYFCGAGKDRTGASGSGYKYHYSEREEY